MKLLIIFNISNHKENIGWIFSAIDLQNKKVICKIGLECNLVDSWIFRDESQNLGYFVVAGENEQIYIFLDGSEEGARNNNGRSVLNFNTKRLLTCKVMINLSEQQNFRAAGRRVFSVEEKQLRVSSVRQEGDKVELVTEYQQKEFPTRIVEVRHVKDKDYLFFGDQCWMIGIYNSDRKVLKILKVPGPNLMHRRVIFYKMSDKKQNEKELEVMRVLKYSDKVSSYHIWHFKSSF